MYLEATRGGCEEKHLTWKREEKKKLFIVRMVKY